MNESSHMDPMAQLWQSTPKPDTGQLMSAVRRLHESQRWNHRVLAFILCGFALFLAFCVAAERSRTLGIVAALWFTYVAGAIWYQRARCRLDVLSLDTASLLKRMISRARRGLFQARCLYIGVPAAALTATVLTRISGLSLTEDGHPIHQLAQIQTIAGLVMLAVMIVSGLVLARARNRQLVELSEKLRWLEDK